MNKRIFIMSFVALFMALDMSQSVMAKKITYLGHYYNGKVNKEKIPEGEGGIAIADVAVFGTFNANNITNAKIEEDWIKITGEISFDKSDCITVKAGSKISGRVYLSSTINFITKEEDLKPNGHFAVVSYEFKKTLKKDSIVDLASAYADFNFRTKVYELAPNPPTVRSQIHAELVPIEIDYDVMDAWGRRTGQTAKRQTKIYKIEKRIKDIEYRLENHKDEFGRIWNVSGPTSLGKCVGKVTYPNGNYITTTESGSIGEWEIKYPNDFVLRYDNKRGTRGIYSDGTEITFGKRLNSDYEFNYYISRSTIDNAENPKIHFPQSKISKLSNKEIVALINDKISQNIEKTFSIVDVYDGGREVGQFFLSDNKYISYQEQAEKYAAAEAAKAKALNAKTANFRKKYGFDPSIDDVRYIVKVGRNILHVVDARNLWVNAYGDHRNAIVTAALVKDQGTSKCYKFYWMNGAYYMGYLWVRNNIITSITWR